MLFFYFIFHISTKFIVLLFYYITNKEAKMTVFEIALLNGIFILFPLFSYFLLAIYQQDNKEENNFLFFDLALYTILYLLLKFDIGSFDIKITLLTIPLFLACLKKRTISFLILSIIVLGSYYFMIRPIFLIGISELILYFVSYLILTYYKASSFKMINLMMIIKIIFLYLYFNVSNQLLFSLPSIIHFFFLGFIYYSLILLSYLLLRKGETMINLHMTIKQLKKEKQLRDSLFKITHEIKNPIAVCKGYLDMLDINNKLHLRKYIPIVKQEIERTLMLMNDFLNLTKLKVVKRKIDLSVLMEDVCDLGKELIKAHKMEFIDDIEDIEIYINGDYDRLKQVFINLIKNAIEAIPQTRKGIIKLEVNKRNKRVSILITDNGKGMDEEALNKVGNAFYSTKTNGTGLGIKLSKEIIDEHQGTIKYRSKLKKGTIVIIDLPLIK